MKSYTHHILLLWLLFFTVNLQSWGKIKTVESLESMACDAPDITALHPGPSSCQVTLSLLELNVNYQFRYRIKGKPNWETQTTKGATLHLAGLQACTEYEFQVRKDCFNSQFSNWSYLQNIKTQGCNETYCLAYASRSDGYIEQFSFGDVVYQSGNDGGLGLHLAHRLIANPGTEIPFSITPVKTIEFWDTDVYFRVYYTIFIDFNRDKDFDDAGEAIFKDEGAPDKVYSWKLAIPKTASQGLTRMRVIMSRKTLGKACERSINILEVEDYSLGIFTPCPAWQPSVFKLDSVSSGNAALSITGENTGYSWRYRIKGNTFWTFTDSTASPNLSISGLIQNTEYEVQVRRSCGGGNWGSFSNTYTFKTLTCSNSKEMTWVTYLREKSRVGLELLGQNALNYRWRYSPDYFKWSPIYESKIPKIELDSLDTGRVYQIEVSIECSAGNWSNWTRSSFFTWGECQQIPSSQMSIGIDLSFRSDIIILSSKMQTADQFFWRYRELGTNQWVQTSTKGPYLDWFPSDQTPGTVHEWQVSYLCENGQKSEWSEVKQIAFSPEVCEPAQTKFVKIKRINATSAVLYADIPYGVQFNWRWREKGMMFFWNNLPGSSYANKEIVLNKLKPNTTYEYQFSYWCTYSIQGWSDTHSFKTLNGFSPSYEDSVQVSIKNPPRNIPIVVSPNPNTGVFRVESVFTGPKNATLTVRDLIGRVIFRRELQDQIILNETLQLSNQAAGTYFLEIRTAEFSKIEKIIIQQP
jgi:chitodextrinase